MNMINLFNQIKSSERKSYFLAMPQLLHRVVAILALLMTCSGVWATDYVFVYNGSNYLSNNNGTIANSTSFVPNTCIWTCDNNSLDNNTSRALHSYGSTSTYLRGATTNGNSPSTGNSQDNWRLNGSNLYYRSGGTAYYLYYRGNQWRLSSNGSSTQNTGYLSNNGKIDYRATAYAVTTTSVDEDGSISEPSITVNSVSVGGNTITLQRNGNLSGTYTPAYTKYTFNGNNHFWYDDADHTTAPAQVTVSNPTYEWSITQGGSYATINKTSGVVTLTSLPTTNQTITVQLKSTSGSITRTTTQNITFSNYKASQSSLGTPEVSCTGISEQYVNTTHTNVTGKYTPAYSTFTIGGQTYKYSGGKIYANSVTLEEDWSSIAYTFRASQGTATADGGLKITSTATSTTNVYWKATATATDGTISEKESAAFPVKVTNVPAKAPTVAFDSSLASDNSGIQLTPTLVGEKTYIPEYGTVAAGDKTSYYYNSGCNASAPASTDLSSDVTYTWNATDGGAVGDTNILTLTAASDVTVTAKKGDFTATSLTKAFALTSKDEDVQASTPDIIVTPNVATMGYGTEQVFTIPASVEHVKMTVAAHNEITVGSTHYYKHADNKYYSSKPKTVRTAENVSLTSATWSPAQSGFVTITQSGRTATVKYDGKQTGDDNTRLAINVAAKYGTEDKAASSTVTLLYSYIDVATITGVDMNMYIGETEKATFSFTPSSDNGGVVYKNFTYVSRNEAVATINEEGEITAVSPGTADILITYNPEGKPNRVKRAAGDEKTLTVTVGIKAPTVAIDASGNVTITDNNVTSANATIKYTTDGTDPVTSATAQTGTPSTTVPNGTTVKAVAIKGTGELSVSAVDIAYYVISGTTDNTVFLNDYEDHNWAYYKGREGVKVGTADDAPDYNDKYLYTLYSPDPRNVKITYRGFNTDANIIILGSNTVNTSTLNTNTTPHVSNATGEGQNTFVYYKTLEKFVIGYFTDSKDWNGIPDDPTKENYPYTVISNPFSVRPSTGSGDSKKYYGFAGWKIISGGKYIGRGNEGTYTAASDGDVLGLDELIHFVNLDDVAYTPNCTSAEVVLEATWAEATVWSGNTAHDFGKTGTYETNFIVASANIGSIEQGTPCTIMAMNPDGTDNNSGTRTITGLKVTTTSTTDPYDRSNCVKVEWIRHGNGTFDANGRNMTMGRGIISSSGSGNTAQGYVYGNNTNGQNVVNTVKVESGYYSGIANINNKTATSTNVINSYVIMGCDYDRALTNYYVPASKINDNAYNIKLRASRIYGPNGSPELNRKNGQLYMRSLIKSGVFASEIDNEYYFHTYQKPGQRYIEMEGGYNKGHVKGGSDGSTSQGRVRAMSIRMKGGRIDGQLACGSTSTFCSGDRLIVITGGRIGGWIAPGSNCSSGGDSSTSTTGTTDGASYVYFGGTAEINSHQFESTPSMIFQSTGGVIYGAGLGYKTTDRTGEMTLGSNIVFADDAYCERGIYGGGAIGQTLTTANIFILGGRVGTGTGEITDQGTKTKYDNVPAGVYGGACNRGGENSFIYMDDGIVESGIYGGSNINGSMTGNVTMQICGGQVGYADANANVHGGGYGNGTRVLGSVDVTIGEKDADEGAVIYGDVYGGSAEGKTNGYTNRQNNAVTNVTLNAGTINGSLYGGGLGTSSYAADVYGPVQVTVNGGTVNTTSAVGSGAVYGCNNLNGAPQSTVKVDIYGTDPAPAENQYALDAVYGGGNMANYSAGTPEVTVHNCDNSIGTVYGGGNAANITGTGHGTNVTIWGGNVIGKVFGGGNGEREGTKADISGGTNVTIHGGTILEVYGGSNTRGTIGGTINVTVNEKAEKTGEEACPTNINNVFGGGNLASSAAANMTIGCASHIGAVYGGANQADITSGNIDLTIAGGNIDNVFGGNNISGTISGTIKVTVNENKTTYPCGMEVGNVYGAGNQAAYTNAGAYPEVNILNGNVTGDVFGGGLGETAVVTSNPAVLINGGTVQGNVFGGGSEANTVGNPVVTMQSGYVGTALYGGGALADVTGNTTVSLTGGTVNDVYGGGLGRLAGEGVDAVAAIVTGNTNVTLNGSVVTGSIFGCNNLNGTPQGHAKVLVTRTTAQPDAEEGAYHVAAVYGGGNQAAYIPTNNDDFAEVEVEGCNNSIEYVYGGGNAASSPATQVTINGGRMYYVFGGGNGAGTGNPGADIGYKDFIKDDAHAYGPGTTTVNIYGGVIETVFGGSNTLGNIRVSSNVDLDDHEECDFDVKAVYGAGNQAEMYGNGNLIIGCIPGLEEIYGGAKNADIHGDISLTIRNGKFKKVFGGNNLGGNINGTVTVNIEETGCRQIEIDELYGGGNLADYTAPVGKTNYPEVNVLSATKIGQIFGGGKGESTGVNAGKGKVTGNPHVNVNMIHGYLNKTTEQPLGSIGEIFGGGNAADVDGDTYVNIGTEESVTHASIAEGEDHHTENVVGVNISGNVYGGGNQADVTGKTFVTVGKKKNN